MKTIEISLGRFAIISLPQLINHVSLHSFFDLIDLFIAEPHLLFLQLQQFDHSYTIFWLLIDRTLAFAPYF